MQLQCLTAIFILFVTFKSWGAPFERLPGAIPLKYTHEAASDLVFQGKLLFPDEAKELLSSKIINDLTDLDPREDSVIWSNTYKSTIQNKLLLHPVGETLTIIESIPRTELPIGQFGLRALTPRGKPVRVLFDVKAHNFLLRKALLEKIGYNTPAINYIKRVQLKFKGAFTKNEFIKDLGNQTLLPDEATKKWLPGEIDQLSDTLTAQDIIIIENSEDEIYNVAYGIFPANRIKGRRLFNSLIIPFNLLDVPESVNLYSWIPGRIFNEQLILPYEYGEDFTTTYEDARWITKRILKLNIKDWHEIISFAKYPKEVEILVFNKTLSRRNFLREKLNLVNSSKELPFDSSPSYGERLKKGKLIGRRNWLGYATYFVGFDPDDPLSATELWSFLGSKTITNVIGAIVNEFNKRYIPRTDIQFEIFDHQLDLAAQQFAQFLTTGEVSPVEFGFWNTKFYDINFIGNREVIAGNYLGSENIVQLADTFGLVVDAGLYIGADGLPSLNTFFSGQAKLNLVRTYTHLKPVTSIKASLKEDYRNMFVPIQKFFRARPLNGLKGLDWDQEDRKKLALDVQKIINSFKKNMGVGESLIIQTGLSPEINGSLGYQINEDVQTFVQLRERVNVISRLNIYRASEDHFHIYQDPAIYNTFTAAIGLNARIPILNLGFNWDRGWAKTHFFDLDLSLNTHEDDPLASNPDLFNKAMALKRVLQFSRLDYLKTVVTPWEISHDFSQRLYNFDLLFWKNLAGRQSDHMTITEPDGFSKKYYRHVLGGRSGKDYQSSALQVIDELFDEFSDFGEYVDIRSTNSGNSGDTFYGKSESRQVTVEGVEDRLGGLDLNDIYMGVSYRYKGWIASQRKILEIFKEINKDIGEEIFEDELMLGVTEVQFYNISYSISLYESALEHFKTLTFDQISSSYQNYGIRRPTGRKEKRMRLQLIWGAVKDVQKLLVNKKAKKTTKAIAQMLHLFERNFKFKTFLKLIGGKEHYFIEGQLSGFQENSENGDRDLIAHTVGTIGSNKPRGPLAQTQNLMGISPGELFISWLLERF